MLILSTLIFLLFVIQFTVVKRKVGENRSIPASILYYSSCFFMAVSGILWFLILTTNVIFVVYSLMQG